MFLPTKGTLLPRLEGRDVNSTQEVPLWAFVVMTVFSIILMIFVGVLLWRPDFIRSLQQPPQDGSRHSVKVKEPLGQQQGAPISRAGSLCRPWRSGGSFRSNIDRWRKGVDRNESPYPSSGDEDWPVVHNYAPPPARPISHMQGIPEQHESPGGNAKSTTTEQRW